MDKKKKVPDPSAEDIYSKKLRQLMRLREHYNERWCRMRDYVERIDAEIAEHKKTMPAEVKNGFV